MIKNLVLIVLLTTSSCFSKYESTINGLSFVGYWVKNELDVPVSIFTWGASKKSIVINPNKMIFVLEQDNNRSWGIDFEYKDFFYILVFIPHVNTWDIHGQNKYDRADFIYPLNRIPSGDIFGIILKPSVLWPGEIVVDELQHS